MDYALIICLWILAIPAVIACLYLLVFTLLSHSLKLPPASSRRMRFDIIVPAHNEEAVLGRVIATVKQVDWPADGFRVIVVADNCTDSTASVARAAGAIALERHDTERRGKGYALDYAFAQCRKDGFAEAFVIIDADAEVSTNLLEAVARRMEQGAQAVQVHYGVSNANASWRTRLLSIAKASFHIVRSRARERLGLSCGIRGNGWAVTPGLLERVPYRAFSLTEDLEYGIDLGLAGYRVHYADEAHSNAEMVSAEKAAGKQRQRWEQGRFQLIRTKTGTLLLEALKQRSRVCMDLALDLLVLPVSYVALNAGLLLLVAALAFAWKSSFAPWLWLGVGCVGALVLYILRGWQLSGAGMRGLLDLARAPFFIAWKIIIMLSRRESKEWVRTTREGS
ncbi:MAG: glycosyltransferase family 2 protein [Gammaproteobacteria bacterium]